MNLSKILVSMCFWNYSVHDFCDTNHIHGCCFFLAKQMEKSELVTAATTQTKSWILKIKWNFLEATHHLQLQSQPPPVPAAPSTTHLQLQVSRLLKLLNQVQQVHHRVKVRTQQILCCLKMAHHITVHYCGTRSKQILRKRRQITLIP